MTTHTEGQGAGDVISARHQCFEQRLGPLPDEVHKPMNLGPAWPGGALVHLAAERVGPGIHAYVTDGLSNPDQPTGVRIDATNAVGDGIEMQLSARTPRSVPDGAAGYGFEFVALTEGEEPGMLAALDQLVQLVILSDFDPFDSLRHDGSVTIEDLAMGPRESGDFILRAASEPLPGEVALPNGSMRVLTLTWITRDEMEFALEHGRPALLARLQEAGVGVASRVGRLSVLDPAPLRAARPSPELLAATASQTRALFNIMVRGTPAAWEGVQLTIACRADPEGRARTVRCALHDGAGQHAVASSELQRAAADLTKSLLRQGQTWDRWGAQGQRGYDGSWRFTLRAVRDEKVDARPAPDNTAAIFKPWWKFW